MNPRVTALLFAALVLFFLGTSLAWLLLDRSAPTWDDAIYLKNSLTMFDALGEGGLLRYAGKYFTVMQDKPPLIAALPTPVYLLVGRRPRAAPVVNLAFLLLLFAAVFRMASKSGSPRAGLLAVYLVATMPMLYGLSRVYLVECGLTAVVAASVCTLWELDGRGVIWKMAVLGFLCGLGLLLKFSSPLYVLVPFAVSMARQRRSTSRPKALAAFAIPLLLLAAPWYAMHFRSALQTALDTGSTETMSRFVIGENPHSFPVMWAYLGRLANAAPLLYVAAAPVLLVLGFKRLSPAARSGLKLCVLWATPLLFLLIWRSREVRYAAPLYPALAVGLAILAGAAIAPGSRWKRALAGAVLLPPLISMLQVSFGWFDGWRLEMSGLLFRRLGLVYARPYDPRPWPFREILEDLHRTPRPSFREQESLLVGTDSSQFNADTFKLAAAQARLPVQIETTAYETGWSDVAALIDWATFFVYEEGGQPVSDYFNVQRQAVLREVRDSGRFVELPLARRMPDGGTAHVFENRSQNGFVLTGAFLPAAARSIPQATVTFGGAIELSGVAVDHSGDRLEVAYRWRSLRPVDREYWCFTHILDSGDHIVGYLDHRILDGSPPLAAWKAGDVAVETLHYQSASIRSGESYRLKLGLYDRATGKRLTISGSSLALADDRTAAIVSGNER